ncbi:MAG TPA: hypothetical protein PK990_00515 [Salinivirgaceae bacterium]|nr:hypothetical protein [Salinivirgaceae bacterium]
MIQIQTFGAIDIGSNAVRLIITSVYQTIETVQYKKITLVRVPIRLGEDVFTVGSIGEEKLQLLLETIHGFKHLLVAFGVSRFRACATSAMREATNASDVVKKVKEETGISIEIISGEEEAFLIQSGGLAEMMDRRQHYLYVDVGGGSTEIVWYSNHETVTSKSFAVGSVRSLTRSVQDSVLEEMKDWLSMYAHDYPTPVVIGSGGNINRFLKLTGKEEGEPIKFKKLVNVYKQMLSMSYEERLMNVNLSPHRADVIIPALEIFISIMKIVGAKYIIVPKIGLGDGIIRQLFRESRIK